MESPTPPRGGRLPGAGHDLTAAQNGPIRWPQQCQRERVKCQYML
ncbi:MAG TPA: hypothetical protein VIY52_07755 [Streptosporangiaceae bacterium]